MNDGVERDDWFCCRRRSWICGEVKTKSQRNGAVKVSSATAWRVDVEDARQLNDSVWCSERMPHWARAHNYGALGDKAVSLVFRSGAQVLHGSALNFGGHKFVFLNTI